MIAPHTQVNFDRFYERLTLEYTALFKLPAYAIAAARYTPDAMARKMTIGLDTGTADKAGEGIRRTCKALGISHTYKAIRTFLDAQ